MRTLCLSFPESLDSDSVEKFTTFSPLIFYREPGLLFIEIESTAHLFQGEHHVLQKCLRLAEHHSKEVRAGIGSTPYSAQVLARSRFAASVSTSSTNVHHLDSHSFGSLPLESLVELEGLTPWESRRAVENFVRVLESLGLEKFSDLLPIPSHQFRARCGQLGISLWKRLHQKENQIYFPWRTKNLFYSYVFFDYPVENRVQFLGILQGHLNNLFTQLERGRQFCRSIQLTLHCEFSGLQHHIQVEPIAASRDLDLFVDLLEKRLEKIDLQNPIRDVEIQITDVPEKVYQLDFFEPIDPSSNKWSRLISFCRQMGFEVGFLQPQASHYPEESYQLQTTWPDDRLPQDEIRKVDDAIQIKSVYAKALSKSPRPSLLLKEPRKMNTSELKKLRFLSSVPCERIGTDWWVEWKDNLQDKMGKKAPGPNRPPARDYYFALSAEGQFLWLYQEHKSRAFFLHGHFD